MTGATDQEAVVAVMRRGDVKAAMIHRLLLWKKGQMAGGRHYLHPLQLRLANGFLKIGEDNALRCMKCVYRIDGQVIVANV
jgi:hypothetical protein